MLRLNHKYSYLTGIVYIYLTFNNTLISVTDINGKTILFASSGLLGLKGAKRGTSYAGQSIAMMLSKKLYLLGFRFLYIQLKGFGGARRSVLKGFTFSNFKVISIKDRTAIAHNGCKQRKKRRI